MNIIAEEAVLDFITANLPSKIEKVAKWKRKDCESSVNMTGESVYSPEMMRFFQIAIVIFWLGSVGWLAKTVLTPDEAGMVKIDPRRPVRIFFDWNDTSRMILLQNGKKLGEMQVVGFSKDDKGNPSGFSLSTILNGDVDIKIMGAFARVLCRFEEDFSWNGSDFLFRMPTNNFRVLANLKGANEVIKAEASIGGNQFFSYDKESGESLSSNMLEIAKQNTMVTNMLSKAGDPSSWKWEIEAFRGMRTFAGRRLPVYLIKLSMNHTDQSLRIYLSESGEPLQFDSDLGFEAISEVLAPIKNRPLQRAAQFN